MPIMPLRLYWFTFPEPGALPVTMPLLPRTQHFRWTGIYGLQVGSWFFGVVRGGPDERKNATPDPTRDGR